jgi:anaerobic ribonucleoside-triphosphate reductase activating protein
MIKYVKEDTSVCFAEIPIEISLCLNLSLCPHRCPGCHSSYLQTDIGDELTTDILDEIINKNPGITCVLFLGGDNDKSRLVEFAKHINNKYNLKVGWYSGESELDLNEYGRYFNYIKIGPYIKELGPLNSQTTNQRLYEIIKSNNGLTIKDITFTFWK